jgi:hypothetical protein
LCGVWKNFIHPPLSFHQGWSTSPDLFQHITSPISLVLALASLSVARVFRHLVIESIYQACSDWYKASSCPLLRGSTPLCTATATFPLTLLPLTTPPSPEPRNYRSCQRDCMTCSVTSWNISHTSLHNQI